MTSEFEATVAAARAAGTLLREKFGRPEQVSSKGSAIDLVTEMDRASEQLLVERLGEAFPDYGFLTEESEAIPGGGENRWIIDPIDGTSNYVHGFPYFSISIALERAGEIVLGVVYNPIHDELFSAEKGQGARLNGKPIYVSTRTTLAQSLVISGFPYDVWTAEADNIREWTYFLKRVSNVRCNGSAALDLCSIASGRADGYWERGDKVWDVAAGGLIVREAGGRATDYQGNDDFIYSQQVVAANPQIHAQLLAGLREVGAAR